MSIKYHSALQKYFINDISKHSNTTENPVLQQSIVDQNTINGARRELMTFIRWNMQSITSEAIEW